MLSPPDKALTSSDVVLLNLTNLIFCSRYQTALMMTALMMTALMMMIK